MKLAGLISWAIWRLSSAARERRVISEDRSSRQFFSLSTVGFSFLVTVIET